MNAIVYVLCQGCTWRALPADPAWSLMVGIPCFLFGNPTFFVTKIPVCINT